MAKELCDRPFVCFPYITRQREVIQKAHRRLKRLAAFLQLRFVRIVREEGVAIGNVLINQVFRRSIGVRVTLYEVADS